MKCKSVSKKSPRYTQNALRDAYDNDTVYAFKVQFPSGKGFKFLAEVRQHTWSSGTNGVVAAT
ncbi:hypothetical protein F7919_005132, partial [Escherichia coli]|nr:hypothetical protein [Escherichia coli]